MPIVVYPMKTCFYQKGLDNYLIQLILFIREGEAVLYIPNMHNREIIAFSLKNNKLYIQ